jgi:outer membrane protein assembly factor BamB
MLQLRAVVMLLALACSAGGLHGQERLRRPFREAVTLAVDAEAARTLLTLEDRWEAGQWGAALDTLIELSETRGRSLVQVEVGDGGGVSRYVQVQQACDQLLAVLPPEGLEQYRRRIAPRAQRLWDDWEQRGDVAALERLVEQMFYSRLGNDAAWALGQAAWQQGRIAAARQHWRTLLPAEAPTTFPGERRHPDPRQPPAEVAARLVLCDLMQGDLAAARSGLAAFTARHPDAEGTLAGRSARWSDLLADELAAATQWTPLLHEDDVPTFAGSPARTQRLSQPSDLGGELWSATLPTVRLPGFPRPAVFPVAPPLAYHPAVVDDVVYLNDGVRIFAWKLDTGRPAWGIPQGGNAQIYPVAEPNVPQEPRRPVSGAPLWTVTITGGRLYARMGSAVTTPSPLELRDHRTEVVCLDISRGEGRLVWSRSGDELAAALADPEEAPAWSWEGTPLAEQGRLYAVLSRRRPQLEWSVLCLDAETGLVLWHRPVGISRPTPADHENLATQLLLTAGSGQLFLSTDWGAIAALDAATGHLRWAVTYESEPLPVPQGRPWPRWAGPPCVFADGRVFAAPLDSDRVFCLDADTGRMLWQRRAMPRVRHLLGVAEQRLVVSGDALSAWDVRTGDVHWAIRPTEPEEFGYGRGCLAGDVVYWPSREAVMLVNLRTGQVLREQPLLTPDARRFGGNLLVSGGVLLVASADRLTAYGEHAQIEQTQEQRLSQQPEDPRTRRRLAELAKFRGDPQRARELLATLPARSPAEPWTVPTVARRTPASRAPVEPAERAEITTPPGYWARTWQRPLIPGREAVLIPEGSCPVMLVQSHVLTARDRRTGDVRWTTPLDRPLLWAAGNGSRLVWATSEDFVACHPDSGEVLYRVAWREALRQLRPQPLTAAAESLRCLRSGGDVVLCDPQLGVVVCDEQTGAIAWRRTFADPIGPDTLSVGGGTVAWHSRGRSRGEWRSQASGQLLFAEPAPTDPWPRPTVWSSRGDQGATVGELGRMAARSPTGAELWEAHGPKTFAHAAPWLFERNGHWYAVFDGLTLTRLGSDGSQAWAAPLATGPLTDPPRQLGIAARRVIAAVGGVVRCVALRDGHTVWSRPVLETGPQRIVFAGNDALRLPEPPASPVRELELFSVATGQPRQKFRLPEPSQHIDAVGDEAGLLIATETALLAFAPQPPVRIAQDR